jgi:mannosyltransferase
MNSADIDTIVMGRAPELVEQHEEVEPSKPIRSWLTRWVWLWPALVAAVLGAYHLIRPELWRDELATWDAASRTIDQLFRLLQHTDASSGAYYLFMHGWISVFGDSVAALRMPSLLAMAGASAFTALCAKRMFGHRAGLTAGLVLAVLPAVSRYAQEARSYALTVCAVAAATWLLLRALERPQALRWMCYAAVVAVTGALNLVALAFLAGHAVAVALGWWRERDHRSLIGFPLACLVAVAVLAPMAWIGMRQAGKQISWIAKPDLATVFTTWPELFGSALVAGAVTIAATLTFAARRWQAQAGVAMAVLPVVVIWIVSQGQSSYWLPRYLLFALPAWALLAGAGIAALRPATAVAGLVVLASLGVPEQRELRTPGSHDWWNFPTPPAAASVSYSGAAAVIAQGYRPGDGVVPVRDSAAYYLLDTGLRYNLPRVIQPRDVFAGRTGVELGEFFTQDAADPSTALHGEQRLWLVTVGQPADPPQSTAPAKARVLRDHFRVTKVVHPSENTTVALLERRS